MAKAHSNWPHLQPYFDQLLKHYSPFNQVSCRLAIAENVTLDIHFGDALERLKTLYLPAQAGVDCWYLDGFSPRLNTDLWSEALCYELQRLSSSDATLSTYSAAGWVRANLTSAGFQVSKTQGFAGKRHMLTAIINKPEDCITPPKSLAPWAVPPHLEHQSKSVVIIGAGLAGASTAYALAQRGLKVTVIDSSSTHAQSASGINQLALRPRLFKQASAVAEFYLQAFLFANNQYQTLPAIQDKCWQQCGVLQNTQAQNKKQPLSNLQLTQNYSDDIAYPVDNEQACSLAKLNVSGEYIYFQNGGWVDPIALCSAYLLHPNITTNFGIEIDAIEGGDTRWLCKQSSTNTVFESDALVLANGIGAKNYEQTRDLPLQAVRGQATYIDASSTSSALDAVVMAQRSVFPQLRQQHTVSASYGRDTSLEHSAADDLENLAGLRHLFSEGVDQEYKAVGAKVALRCNSQDFLPVIGMVANKQEMTGAFAMLKRNAQAAITGSGKFHQNLYITSGHGSNGTATCPLAAEHLANLICNEASILNGEMMSALSPARFLIRDLKKQASGNKTE